MTGSDARRVIAADFPDEEMRGNVWGEVVKGEKVFVHQGQVEWVSDATV